MRWQSWLVLAMVVPWCTISALRYALTQWSSAAKMALGISLGLTLLVFLARAATLAAALTGGVLTAVVTLGLSPWYQSGLPSLLSLFVLTWTATRFGRSKKERLGVAEDKRGRNAAQVAANLGVAALAATLALGHPLRGTWYAVMMIAALAEATADTLASELGEVLGGPPLLLTTLRRVAPGTDGAISLAGTVAGTGGAVLIVLVAVPTLGLRLVMLYARDWGRLQDCLSIPCWVRRLSGAAGSTTTRSTFFSTLAAALIAVRDLLCGKPIL